MGLSRAWAQRNGSSSCSLMVTPPSSSSSSSSLLLLSLSHSHRALHRSTAVAATEKLEYFVMSDDSAASHPIGAKRHVFSGWLFLIFGSFSFLVFLFAAIISKLLPPSGNQIISAIQNDRYYCFLVPLTLPVLVVAVYFHWLSMKLFKHA